MTEMRPSQRDGHPDGCRCTACTLDRNHPDAARETAPLTAYMQASTGMERDAAYLRLYAEKIRSRTEVVWETPNTRAATLEDIAARMLQRPRQRHRRPLA